MTANQNIFSKCSFPLGKVGIGCLLALTACSTTTKLPSIDDAYYQPEKTTYTSSPVRPATAISQEPSIEYLNVQDTTVTIRIKR